MKCAIFGVVAKFNSHTLAKESHTITFSFHTFAKESHTVAKESHTFQRYYCLSQSFILSPGSCGVLNCVAFRTAQLHNTVVIV